MQYEMPNNNNEPAVLFSTRYKHLFTDSFSVIQLLSMIFCCIERDIFSTSSTVGVGVKFAP